MLFNPPYYAVIFSSKRTEIIEGYSDMANLMVELAQKQEGYLGMESVRDPKLGITVSYWRDIDSIRKWKQQSDHLIAQQLGKEKWYSDYTLRVAKVEREYEFLQP